MDEENLPPRVRAAEDRREFRELLERSSVGQADPERDANDPEFIAEVFRLAAEFPPYEDEEDEETDR